MVREMNMDVTQYIDAALQLHGLVLDDASRAEVGNQFGLLKSMMSLIESESLSAEIESANIFRL